LHDLLAPVGKESVMADITAWIDRRLPARGLGQVPKAT
jgi:hypothetical protein